MKKLLSLIALVAASLSAPATTHVIDNFLGGPDLVFLTSLTPPQIATGTFPAPGNAIGGVRDAAVWSVSQGIFASGVAFDEGGYASFTGSGAGGIVWDGVLGISDANNDKTITPDELDFGLGLDLSDCQDGTLEVTAFADLPAAVLRISIGSDAGNYNVYDIALAVGTADYSVDLSFPTSTVGVLNYAAVGAVALFVDGTAFDNLDVSVSRLEISCPDGGWTLGCLGLGLLGIAPLRRFIR